MLLIFKCTKVQFGFYPNILLSFLLLQLLASCGPQLPVGVEGELAALPKDLDFNIHVKPVLSDRCFACHGPDQAKREAGLRLDNEESAYAALVDHPDKFAIKPGNLANSEVYHRIVSANPEEMMPPPESDLHLTDRDKAILIRWIQEGAEYKPHWAFIPPTLPSPPKLEKEEWATNEIDHFIRRKIDQKGWKVSPAADKEMLLRRLSFDLTGLPPSSAQMDQFLADESPESYEKMVDQMLASSAYGERMATDWMDVSRFADTHGYTVDRYRDMSPWRDWVIKAFNENMPYDQFVTWQLAGDLLPNATDEQILATGFNRNHQQNMEGGIVPEEFRTEYVADRANTIGAAFIGITMECARCHDHKYDPITQKNYYELFSFFNNVQEAGQISYDNAMAVPTLLLKDEKTDSLLEQFQSRIKEKEQEIAALDEEALSEFTSWLAGKKQRLKAYPKGLVAHFDLDNSTIKNKLSPYQKGVMKQQHVKGEIAPNISEGKFGQGLLLDGDAWLDLGNVAAYDRATPFSISIWANIPTALENGVLFHKGVGAALYNFRGFHLALKDNKLELLMARTEPYNAIIEYVDKVPRDKWIQLTMTYDGSSKAKGLKLFINGEEQITQVTSDNLYKSILFQNGGPSEPGLQIGARWRGIGAGGTTVDEILVFDRTLTDLEVKQLVEPSQVSRLLAQSASNLPNKQKELLADYFIAQASPKRNGQLDALSRLRRQYNQVLDTIKEIMVMREMAEARPSYILQRGQYDVPGERVYPNTPEHLLEMPEDYPKNRLGLTQWLLHPDHPTTARVIVNRYWQQFFGLGLVPTSEDFGNQGDLPSHPELLDWLAVNFRTNGWDIKQTIKLIVMSSTYRQSSKASTEQMEADPQNIFLARGPSMRLSAEMLRDNVLSASGLLSSKIGGPSVKPYQPAGLWRINGTRYQADTGEKLYRRSLYTFWKRTIPHPTQATFDAPSRANCSVRRQKTSTPLQALVLLNDPIFVEAAKVIGQQIALTDDTASGIQSAFRNLTGRKASAEEVTLLQELQQQELQKFKQYPDKLAGWIQAGEYAIDQSLDPALIAANAVVASTIINADASIVKR